MRGRQVDALTKLAGLSAEEIEFIMKFTGADSFSHVSQIDADRALSALQTKRTSGDGILAAREALGGVGVQRQRIPVVEQRPPVENPKKRELTIYAFLKGTLEE